VAASDSVTFDRTLFDGRDEATVLDGILTARCGADKKELCTATVTGSPPGGRRRLQTSGSYTVSITYEVDAATFAEIENNPALDDPAFITALSAASGIDPSNITVEAVEGTLEITYTLVAESGGDEPLGADVLADIDTLSESLTNVTQAVAQELSIPQEEFATAALDKCDGRDCNGFGAELCDSNTGACNCPAGYWGINCDEQCTCENGGTCPVNYCICDYPYFGPKCQFNATACISGTCGAT
jgi:hypothetical protein